GGNDVKPQHQPRPIEVLGGPEHAAVDLNCRHHLRGREVRREGVWQTKRRSQLRSEKARSENPNRYVQTRTGDRFDLLPPNGLTEVREQFHDVLWKGIGACAPP